jgi:hypothetical protein
MGGWVGFISFGKRNRKLSFYKKKVKPPRKKPASKSITIAGCASKLDS